MDEDISTTTEIEVVVLEAMERGEGDRLRVLEEAVRKAMEKAGKMAGAALLEIRDSRLYRASHKSFEAYCLDRHGISRATAYRMIEVAQSEAAKRETAGQHVSPRDISTEVNTIGQASAKAAERRRQPPPARRETTQDPVTIEPGKPIKPAPEPKKKAPEKPKGEAVTVLPSLPEKVTELVEQRPVISDEEGLRWLSSKTDQQIRALGDPLGTAFRHQIRRWAKAFGTFASVSGEALEQRRNAAVTDAVSWQHSPGCSCLMCADRKGAKR